jgi:S1-C subfamily serine protease
LKKRRLGQLDARSRFLAAEKCAGSRTLGDGRVADLAVISQRQIPLLGIMAVTLDKDAEGSLGPVRLSSGAVVIARTSNPHGADIGLQTGDLIHEINGKDVLSVEDLRSQVATLETGDAVALLVEREGRLSYVAFDMP